MKFTLQIKEPCHENWDNMTANEKGRFCSQCSKTVYDFTNHAPQEINEKLTNNAENICGRIPTTFLNKTFDHTPAFAMAGVLAITGFSAFSQQVENDSMLVDTSKFHIQADTLNNYYKFSGTVTDTSGKPIGGAIIQIKAGEKYIAQGYSLSTGNFALFIDKTKIASDSILISVQKDSFFFSERTIVVSDTTTWKQDFILNNAFVITEANTIEWQFITATNGGISIPWVTLGWTVPLVGDVTVCKPIEQVVGLTPSPLSLPQEQKTDENINERRVKRSPDKNPPRPRGNENKNIETEINAVMPGENEMMVYPNPAVDHVFVEFLNHDSYSVSIYNLRCEIELTESFTGTLLKLDISKLIVGTYIIVAVDDTGREYSRELVKG